MWEPRVSEDRKILHYGQPKLYTQKRQILGPGSFAFFAKR